MATKVKSIPLYGDGMKSPVPVNPLDQDGNMLKPAVTFNANRIAYADGVKVENGEIYETLLNINTDCLATAAVDLQNGIDPKFTANTFAMISRTNTDIIIKNVDLLSNAPSAFLSWFSSLSVPLSPQDR